MANNSGLFSIPAFKNRGIIKLAPDALVYINGALGSAIIAPVTGTSQKMSFNDGITSINIQNNIDPPGSSTASIEITTPIYNEKSNYWVMFPSNTKKTHWVPIFAPMMEIKIYLKGRFLVGMVPRYYPAFWGVITAVNESYASGSWKISLACSDMFTFWRHSTINIHPGIEAGTVPGANTRLSVWKTNLDRANPYEVLYAMTLEMGMYEWITPAVLAQKQSSAGVYPEFKTLRTSVSGYWKERLKTFGTILKMYGAQGESVKVTHSTGKFGSGKFTIIASNPLSSIDVSPDSTPSGKESSVSKARVITKSNKDGVYDMFNIIKGYYSGSSLDRMGTFESSTYMSKMEIVSELAKKIDFELYQDVNGEIIFKPPFYNVLTASIEPYMIRSNDIINCSFNIDSEAIVTAMRIMGPMAKNVVVDAQAAKAVGMHYEIDLAAKYGLRFRDEFLEYIAGNNQARVFAISRLARLNAKATTGSITMPGRPELRLGYPVYVDYRDSYHYVKSINHVFDFGGSFITTLSLEAERTKQYKYENDFWNLQVDKIYKFKEKANITVSPISQQPQDEAQQTLQDSMESNASLVQGRYEIADRKSAGINGFTPDDLITATNKSVPFTDEQGFRVIGAFPYGRGMVPGNTGMIDINPSQTITNTPVTDDKKAKAETINLPGSEGESMLMKPYFNNRVAGVDVEGIVNQYVDINVLENQSKAGTADFITQLKPHDTQESSDPYNRTLASSVSSNGTTTK